MKTKLIKSEPVKDFKPFKIEIEVENLDDVRVLHNCISRTSYDERLRHLYNQITEEIKSQGFEI